MDRLRSRFQLVAFQIHSSVTNPRRSLPSCIIYSIYLSLLTMFVLFLPFSLSLSIFFIYCFVKNAKMEFLPTICLQSLVFYSRFYVKGIKNCNGRLDLQFTFEESGTTSCHHGPGRMKIDFLNFGWMALE